MADSYLRLAVGVLTGIALLMFLVCYGVGIRAKKLSTMVRGWTTFDIGLLVVMIIGYFLLPVSGPLLIKQIFLLYVEIVFALLSGSLVGWWHRNERERREHWAVVLMVVMSITAIGIQASNVHAVLEVLESAGVLKPRDNYKPETNQTCPENLKKLYNAFEQYAEFNDSLPPAADWEANTDLTSRIPQDEWLHCPLVSNGHDTKFGYAYNDAIAGKKLNLKGKPLKTLPNAAAIPLLYDSTDLKKNAHDAFSSLPKPGRHSGRDNVLYLDGSVAPVAPK